MLLQQKAAKVLFVAIDRVANGMPIQRGLEFAFLLWLEMLAATAHQREQAAIASLGLESPRIPAEAASIGGAGRGAGRDDQIPFHPNP
jgi:hypothetical protein